MAPQTNISQELLRAIAHPHRLAILNLLDDQAMTLSALVKASGCERSAVSRHLRSLERAGLVRGAGEGADRLYESATAPHYDSGDWGTLSNVVRREALSTALTRIQLVSSRALEGGGFDRENIHFSRTALAIGEQEFDRLSADFDGLLDRVDDLQKEATENDVQATAVLMLFENPPQSHGTVGPHDVPDSFTTLEGRERSYDLQERIGDIIDDVDVDWDAALNAVDELRVVLNASRLAARRERDHQATPAT
jgi:DNA-binding transcriptional ArsR family regulator